MVHLKTVEDQLKAIGANFRFFGRPEVRELAKIITPGETIAQAVNGYYEGGFAMLAVTNHRLLLVDRKPLFLTLEDIRFDMVSEVDFNYRLLNAMIRVYTPNKSLVFTCWNHSKLRHLAEYLQEQVSRSRQSHTIPQDQFAQMVGQQMAMQQAQPVQGATAIVPALAKTAFQGSTATPIAATGTVMTNRFIAPLSRNPYTKTPLTRRRKLFFS